MKRKREPMPPEYVKGPGKPGHLHPHWRKSFPDDEEEGSDRGKVVDVPDALRLYGEWRRVPGFWKIVASEEGFIATEGERRVRTPSVHYSHYMVVGCNGANERVNVLVARAFHGRPKTEQVSVDHIGGEKLPMAERRADNRAINLKWATASEQNASKGEAKAKSIGEPCLIWEIKGDKLKSKTTPYDVTPIETTEQWFPSLLAAAKELGIDHGNISRVLNGKAKTTVGTDGKRYAGKWTPDHVDLESEEWRVYWKSEKLTLRISNHGRIQWGYPGRWGNKHFPKSSDNKDYLRVNIDGKHRCVHILVGELFWIGPKPRNWAAWDHRDQDKQNNHISNLHPVTLEKNQLNTTRQRDFYLWQIGEPDNWVRCVSQAATARAYDINLGNLNSVLHKRTDKNGYFPKTVNGYCAAFCDEVE